MDEDEEIDGCYECDEPIRCTPLVVDGQQYCDDCAQECGHCGETAPSDQFGGWEMGGEVCDDCMDQHYCRGCEEMVGEWVSSYEKLCDDCDTKQNPHHNYTDIMESLEGLEKELAGRKIALVTGMCCGSCSAAAGYNKAVEKGWRGYAHWNEQCEDSLRRGSDKLYIGFWAVSDDETAAKRVRTSILKALRRVGAWYEPHTDTNRKIEVVVPQEVTEHGLVELAALGDD
jgi:hypothetical protein